MEKETAAAAAAAAAMLLELLLFPAAAHPTARCWALGAGFCPVQDGGWRWTVGGPQASAFSLILLVEDQGPFPGLAGLVESRRCAGVRLGNCGLWDRVRTCWVKLDMALARIGNREWGERGYLGTVGWFTPKDQHPPALDRAALASPRSSTTDRRYLPSGGRVLGRWVPAGLYSGARM